MAFEVSGNASKGVYLCGSCVNLCLQPLCFIKALGSNGISQLLLQPFLACLHTHRAQSWVAS